MLSGPTFMTFHRFFLNKRVYKMVQLYQIMGAKPNNPIQIFTGIHESEPRKQAQLQIRRMIASRGYRQGDRLPSYRDLAGQLGVSVMTIQRAMDDLSQMGLVQRLKGKGAFVARSLIHEAHVLGSVGLISPVSRRKLVTTPYLLGILTGILGRCDDHHIDLRIIMLTFEEGKIPPSEIATTCDGMLFVGVVNTDYIEEFAELSRPLAVLDDQSCTAPLDYVVCDNRQSVQSALQHLHALGHRQIAYQDIGTTDPLFKTGVYLPSSDSHERLEEYQAFMKSRNLAPQVFDYDRKRFLEYKEMALRIKGADPPPTAVLAYDAQTAMLLCREFQNLGMRIPEDISVAGVCGSAADSLAEDFHVTTTQINFPAMGEAGMDILLQQYQQGRKKQRNMTRIGGDFRIGNTTSTAPSETRTQH